MTGWLLGRKKPSRGFWALATAEASRRGPNRPRRRGSRAQLVEDLLVFREAALPVFGEQRFAVDDHLERAARALEQLRVDADLGLDRGRQTGGPG